MLDIALSCIQRGWYVFPCIPRTKKPLGGLVPGGFKDASNDETVIRRWWKAKPDANVAIACGASKLAVLDIDHGIATDVDLTALCHKHGIPPSMVVRTGRRPEFGAQIYFNGAMPDVGLWRLESPEGEVCEGQVKSAGGYVMAPGSIHPSGEAYRVIWDLPVAETPGVVRTLKSETKQGLAEPGKKIAEGAGRHDALMRVACGLRARGLDADAIYAAMAPINEAMCEVPIDDEDLEEMCRGIERRYPVGEPDVRVTIGKKPLVGPENDWSDWKTRFHSYDETEKCPPPTFLIDQFLVDEDVMAIAAPVAQRKTLISLNTAKSLVTGEPLFGHFEVKKKPERVLYLCPEMGLQSFSGRIKAIGLLPYVGKRFFFSTMKTDPQFEHKDLPDQALDGAVVFLDTAIRFYHGNENDSEAMGAFAKTIFDLTRRGARAVVLLHHSSKATKDATTLTLENSMRGSGDFGAFVTSCWATRLREPDKTFDSLSVVEHVKQRDFQGKPFLLESDRETGILTYAGDASGVSLGKAPGRKANKDGRDEEAFAFIEEHLSLSGAELSAALSGLGIDRKKNWCNEAKFKIKGPGFTVNGVRPLMRA